MTFVASPGDSGTTCWPSVSSNVLSVGGTTLTISSSGAYVSETAWSDSGGGISSYESLPSYQKMIGISASGRVTPDVSYDANPTTGYLVYDSLAVDGTSGWMVVGGTSAGAPQWAGIIAIANEGRAANGIGTLTQANAVIYTLYMTKSSTDCHDVTSGSNTDRYSAAKGYDAVTGLGSPIVSLLVGDLATATATSTTASTTKIVITKPSSGTSGGWGGGGWGGGGWGGGGWGGGGPGGGWGGGGPGGGWGSSQRWDAYVATDDGSATAGSAGADVASYQAAIWNFDLNTAGNRHKAVDAWFADLADPGFALEPSPA